MRKVGIFALFLLIGVNVCVGHSLLSPQKFPTTFNDAAFTTRMDVLARGYEPWESEFDSSGRCIRGCAYHGITIEDELSAMRRKTNQVVSELQATGALPQAQPVSSVPITGQGAVVMPSVDLAPVSVGALPAAQIDQAVSCNPRQPDIPATQEFPLGEPVIGGAQITSPFGRRVHPITGNLQNHSGVDLAVPRGTAVFSPASGVVANVWTDDTCGRGLRISHVDGYETVYCHLDNATVSVGDKVSAGCQVAVSGNTGRSTGPHLHYAIKKDGTFIDPVPLMRR